MTEQQWLTHTDPNQMLHFLLTGGAGKDSGQTLAGYPVVWTSPHSCCSDRKLKLYSAAILRAATGWYTQSWDTNNPFRPSNVVRELEEWADGGPEPSESSWDGPGGKYTGAEIAEKITTQWGDSWGVTNADRCQRLRDIFGNPWRPLTIECPRCFGSGDGPPYEINEPPNYSVKYTKCPTCKGKKKIDKPPDTWLTWNGGIIPRMAQQMYDRRDFSDMPVLADALEEAGCDNADILNHCRQPGEHVRGCWVIDLILGKN